MSDQESDYDQESEQEDDDYGDIENITKDINDTFKNNEAWFRIQESKVSLSILLNKRLIDQEKYALEISKLNKEQYDIVELVDFLNKILTKEEQKLEQQLNELIQNRITKKEDLVKLKEIETKIKNIRERYYSINTTEIPEESYSDIQDDWGKYENQEVKEIRKLLTRYDIPIPFRKDYKSFEEFETEKNKVFRLGRKYLNIVKINPGLSNINPEVVEEISKKYTLNIRVEILKELEEYKVEPVQEPESQDNDREPLPDIFCTYIEQLMNRRINVVPYVRNFFGIENRIFKSEDGYKNMLLNILLSLNNSTSSELSNSSIDEIERYFNNKYSIPPHLFNKKVKSYITTRKRLEDTDYIKERVVKVNGKSPLIVAKKTPVLSRTDVGNIEYYVSINDSLYNKLKSLNGRTQQVWLLSVNTEYGVIIKKITDFKEYCSGIKDIFLSKSSNLTQRSKNISDPYTLAILKKQKSALLKKIAEIDRFLKTGQIYKELKNEKSTSVRLANLTYVSYNQRKTTKNKLMRLFQQRLGNDIENILFNITNNNPNWYLNKFNNLLFVIYFYPKYIQDIKNGVPGSIHRALNFESEMLYTLSGERYLKPNIYVRQGVIKKIKNLLNTRLKFNKKAGRIIVETILDKESKRLELFLYDITYSDKEYKSLFSFFLDSLNKPGIVESIIVTDRSIENLFSTFISIDKRKLPDYSKLTTKEIEALISQQRAIIKGEKNTDTVEQKVEKLKNVLSLQEEQYSVVDDSLNDILNELEKENISVQRQVLVKLPVSPVLVKELVNAYKRTLISRFYKTNELIYLLELYDYNEISYFSGTSEQLQYNLIKKSLNSGIMRLTNNSFEEVNYMYYLKSIEQIALYLNCSSNLEDIISNFPKEYPGKLTPRVINSYYNQDLFMIFARTHTHYKFFTEDTIKKYSYMHVTYTPKQKEPNEIDGVVFNPISGEFGKNAYSGGFLFQVYFFEKNSQTGKPFVYTESVEVMHPGTKEKSHKSMNIERPGKTPYIKIPIHTGNEIVNVWREVSTHFVNRYPLGFDSCSIFKKPEDCNKAIGLGGYKCEYMNNICKSTFYKK